MRYAAKRDANEHALVSVAREIGAMLVQAPPLDWWCWFRGRWMLVEIKNPQGLNKLTEGQVLFLAECKRYGVPVWIWRTERDVLDSLGARRTA